MRAKEILRCNVCGRGFYGVTVLDGDAVSASAPRGICIVCQGEAERRRIIEKGEHR